MKYSMIINGATQNLIISMMVINNNEASMIIEKVNKKTFSESSVLTLRSKERISLFADAVRRMLIGGFVARFEYKDETWAVYKTTNKLSFFFTSETEDGKTIELYLGNTHVDNELQRIYDLVNAFVLAHFIKNKLVKKEVNETTTILLEDRALSTLGG